MEIAKDIFFSLLTEQGISLVLHALQLMWDAQTDFV